MKRNINKSAEIVEIIEDCNESASHLENHTPMLSKSQMKKSYPAAPVVSVRDGRVYASSLDVAAFFGKRHDNVVRSIRDLDCSHDFRNLNFEEYKHEAAGSRRRYPAYTMTKDGLTRLVMSFTGEKAGAFLEAYIREFNRMEAALKAAPAPVVPTIPQTMPEALRLAADAMERAEEAEKVNGRLLAFPHSVGVREAAKMLKLPPQELSRMLREWKWTYIQGGGKRTVTLAYQSIIDRGLMVHDAYVTPNGRTVYHPKITPEGMGTIARTLPAFS